MKANFFCCIFLVMLTFCSTKTFGQRDVIETIYFNKNSSVIDKKYLPALNLLAERLIADSLIYLKIFGYADKNGSREHNNILSGKRAEAVYSYLLSRSKVDSNKVLVSWLGESSDVYDLHFPSAHPQLRCVDVWAHFYLKPR